MSDHNFRVKNSLTVNNAVVINSTAITLGSVPISANGSIGTNGQSLLSDGSKNYYGTPGAPGSNTEILFNDSGALGSNNLFYFDKTNIKLFVNTSYINSTAFAVGNSTVNTSYSLNVLNMANSTVASNLALDALKLGGNVVVNTTSISIGNSTANLFANSIKFEVANASGYVNVTPTNIGIGANVALSTVSVSVGNSTVNLFANSVLLGIANSTITSNLTPLALRLGANVTLNTSMLAIGNSTANVRFTQSEWYINEMPFIAGLTEDTAPNSTQDYTVSYDASANASKKVAMTKFLMAANTNTLTVGYSVTPYNHGNLVSFTCNVALGNYQHGVNNTAITITAPTSDGAIDLLMTNNSTAGAITFSGFTVGNSTGDTYATTNANKYILSIRRINGVSTYIWKALQ